MATFGPIPSTARRPRHRSTDFATPDAPPDVPANLATEWAVVWQYLADTGRANLADTALVEAYIRARAISQRARDEHAADGAPLLATGSTGQPVEHPLLKLARESDRDAARYAERLGLDPTSRARLGMDTAAPISLADDLASRIGRSPRATL